MKTPCILFPGFCDPKTGYGRKQIRINGRQKCCYAHRLEWEKHNGPIPEGLEILHSCDNPPCINIEHLRLGTHAENMHDAKRKNRLKGTHLGESHGRHKLKESEVIEIKRRLSKGDPMLKIAQDYGVNHMTIKSIKSGRTWGWLQFSPMSKEA